MHEGVVFIAASLELVERALLGESDFKPGAVSYGFDVDGLRHVLVFERLVGDADWFCLAIDEFGWLRVGYRLLVFATECDDQHDDEDYDDQDRRSNSAPHVHLLPVVVLAADYNLVRS